MCNQMGYYMDGIDGIDGFEDGYIQGYLDGIDEVEAVTMPQSKNVIGMLDLDNFPVTLVVGTVVNTILSNGKDVIDPQLKKIKLLTDETTGNLKPERVGLAKLVIAGIGYMATDNEIVQAGALGFAISAGTDFVEYGKAQGWFGAAAPAATAPAAQAGLGYTPNTRMVTYDDFGMNGWNENAYTQDMAFENSVNSMRI